MFDVIGFEIGIEIFLIWSNMLLVFMMLLGWFSLFGIVIIFLRVVFIINLLDIVLFDVGVGCDRVGFLLVCDCRICDGSVEVIDMGFLEIIKILVDLVGDIIEGFFVWDWRILFGSVIWGIMVVIDRLLVVLLWFSVCCESVMVDDGDSVFVRFVLMFDIIVIWIFFRGFGLIIIFLVFGFIWCMCIIGCLGRCVLFSVWVIVVGFVS